MLVSSGGAHSQEADRHTQSDQTQPLSPALVAQEIGFSLIIVVNSFSDSGLQKVPILQVSSHTDLAVLLDVAPSLAAMPLYDDVVFKNRIAKPTSHLHLLASHHILFIGKNFLVSFAILLSSCRFSFLPPLLFQHESVVASQKKSFSRLSLSSFLTLW